MNCINSFILSFFCWFMHVVSIKNIYLFVSLYFIILCLLFCAFPLLLFCTNRSSLFWSISVKRVGSRLTNKKMCFIFMYYCMILINEYSILIHLFLTLINNKSTPFLLCVNIYFSHKNTFSLFLCQNKTILTRNVKFYTNLILNYFYISKHNIWNKLLLTGKRTKQIESDIEKNKKKNILIYRT